MDTILEEKRSLHEERDRIELAIVNEMLSKKTGHKETLDSEHRQKALVDRYIKCSKTLLKLYEQNAQELAKKRLDSYKKKSNAFNEFYLAIRNIKEFYAKNTNDQVVTMASEFDEIEANRQMALRDFKHKSTMPDASRSTHDEGDEDGEDEHRLVRDDGQLLERDAELQRLARGLPTTDLVDVVDEPSVQAPVAKVEKLVDFTDEEGYGRYLDLTKCHVAFLQVFKDEENKTDYLTFLDKFDRFADIERERKTTSVYKRYVAELLDYFRDYSRRAKPLFDYENFESKIHEEFVKQWQEKTFPGWFNESDRSHNDEKMIDLESYTSHEQLSELGLECLKRELQVRGLKCGGTLEERAKRLFSIKGKADHEIDRTLRADVIVNKKGKKKQTIDPYHIASIEAKLVMYAEFYHDHRQATIENVQRKQARTAEERNDSDEDLSDADEEDPNQEDVIYNPKNLPLGWDGKPIPYWLYKLHGLNLTFTCEICGNATYKGPKTFQRHFAEWRHAHGMRCLGIPNTAHFANITKIQDAISLWEKLKNERQRDKFQPLVEEEYEDSQGNVVNKKTYEDLKRQGLL